MNKIIGCRLKYIRLSRGWTQEFVSNITGISIRTISRIETGYKVSRYTIQLLCNLYRIDICSLYNDPTVTETGVDLIPQDRLIQILMSNSFLSDLQREVILEYVGKLDDIAYMSRSDVEAILKDVLTRKDSYTLCDIITACLAVNKSTVRNIANIASFG